MLKGIKSAREIFHGSISLKKAEEMQDEMELKIEELKKYNPRIQERKDLRNIILDNERKLFDQRDTIIEAFGKPIFQLRYSDCDPIKSRQNFEESIGERVKLRRQESDKLNEVIIKKDKTINKDLFTEYFQFQSLSAMHKILPKAQGTQANDKLVQLIKS